MFLSIEENIIYNMNNTIYLWKFKPNERKKFPMDVVNNNLKYIENYKIMHPHIIEKFVINNNDNFPNLLKLYNRIPQWVIKTDVGRLLAIYLNGGLYADADCFIKKKLDQHNDTDNIILFIEKVCTSVNELGKRECKNLENVVRIANFCFGSKIKEHPFLKEVIEECIGRLEVLLDIENKKVFNNEDVLWVCGPDVITTIYHRSKHKYNDIFLYDTTYLNHKCNGSWR
jgi:mannosyltransferase OCH1-like enzyme